MKIEKIEPPRLYLRGFTPADADFALSIWNDPEMGEYLLDGAMETVSDAYRREIEQLGEDEECCYLIAEDKESGTRIGTCSFIPADGSGLLRPQAVLAAGLRHGDGGRDDRPRQKPGGQKDHHRHQQ